MMFASKSPRDLLLTDEDWAAINRGDYCEEELVGIIPSKFHNAPNTILTHFRQSGQPLREYLYDRLYDGWPSVYHHEIEHGRKVLTRLRNVEQREAIRGLLEMDFGTED